MSTPVQALFDLTGRTALVTDGSRGLGLPIAEALGEAGATLLPTSRKPADRELAAAALQASGIAARWTAADARDPAEVRRGAAVRQRRGQAHRRPDPGGGRRRLGRARRVRRRS
jgi:gluconate 5-dehydrogenase